MIMLQNPFRTRTRERMSQTLYGLAVQQAREPAFYAGLGVPDRIDARFELYTLHILLLVLRLRDEGGSGEDAAQALFDTYVSALDHALRELGVGDMSVGKKMRKLGEALYGRMAAYERPLRDAEVATLAPSLARNIFESEDPSTAALLARYAVESRARLAAQDFAGVVTAPDWSEIGA